MYHFDWIKRHAERTPDKLALVDARNWGPKAMKMISPFPLLVQTMATLPPSSSAWSA